MTPIDYTPRTRLIVRNGGLSQLGAVARELGFARPLLVADAGIVHLGLVDRARQVLAASGIDVVTTRGRSTPTRPLNSTHERISDGDTEPEIED